jgi:hypothetical protein
MKLSLLLFFLIFSAAVFAQSAPEPAIRSTNSLTSGNWQAGLSVSRADAGGSGQVQPRIQYFVRDNWSVGVEGRFQTLNRDATYRSAGIKTRYYLLKTKKVAAFGQIGYFRGKTVARQYTFNKTDPAHPTLTRQEIRQPAGLFTAGAGVQYRIGKRWSAEITLDRQGVGSRAQAMPCSSRWQGSVGLNYQIGR